MTRHHPAGTHPDPRVANLPKWAQQHISHLETRLEEARAQLDAAQGVITDESTSWSGGIGDERRPLMHGYAAFRTAHGHIAVCLDNPKVPGIVRILSSEGGLVIDPKASNHILVSSRDEPRPRR